MKSFVAFVWLGLFALSSLDLVLAAGTVHAAALEAYAPVGPSEVVAEFLAPNKNWIADRRRERYPDTNAVNG